MKKIGLKVFTVNLQKRPLPVYRFLFLLAGIYAILLTIRAAAGIFFSAIVFPAAALICAGLFALRYVGKKWLATGIGGLVLLSGTLAAMRWEIFFSQLAAVFRALTDAAVQRETDVTFAVMLVTVGLSLLFFLFEILCRFHLIPYLLVAAALLGAPFLGVESGIVSVILGLVFQISFWIIHTAQRGKVKGAAEKKQKDKNGVNRGGLFMGAALAVLLCISTAVTAFWGDDLSNLVYSGEGFISRSLQQITGKASIPAADGRVSGGNNYRTGEVQLRVVLRERPGERLYLKGFSGGEYTGGNWEPADDQQVFRRIAADLHWEEWESWIGSLFYNMYFDMNTRSTMENISPRTVRLQHVSENYDMVYAPYYSGWLNIGDLREPGYGFYYYEQSEMNIRWNSLPRPQIEDYLTIQEEWYRQIQKSYMDQIPGAYTEVPEELLPRLTRLCQANPLQSRDEVTAFILSFFQANTSYTLTPGRAPLNEDITEYFLFDRREGYCVHFASAATLIYRLYGVPARYASGYAVDPSDFVRQEDGTWVAEVTDESAHAWTELFIENYGWTPVEVTPSSDGSYNVSYPGLNGEALREMISSMELPSNSGGGDSSSGGEQTETAGDGSEISAFSPEQYREQILSAAVFLVVLFAASPLLLIFRRKRRREKIERMNCREIFGRLMNMLHFAGYLSGYNGTEKDFTEKLAEAVPDMKREEAERLVESVSRAAYGQSEPEPAENDFARRLYRKTADRLIGEMSAFRRLQFRYVKAFW